MQCPECMVIVPMAMAMAGAAGAEKPVARGPMKKPAAALAETVIRPAPPRAEAQSPAPEKKPAPSPESRKPAPPEPTIVRGQDDAPLGCNKCSNQWTETITEAQAVVQCPECMAIVPTVVALKSAKPGAARKAPPPPPKAFKPAEPKPAPPKPAGSMEPTVTAIPAIKPAPAKPAAKPPSPPSKTAIPSLGGMAPASDKTVKLGGIDNALKLKPRGPEPPPPGPAKPSAPTAPSMPRKPPAAPPTRPAPRTGAPISASALSRTNENPLEGTMRIQSTAAEDEFLEAMSRGKVVAEDVSEMITHVPSGRGGAPAAPTAPPQEAFDQDMSDMPTVIPASKAGIGPASRAKMSAAETRDDGTPDWERQTRTGADATDISTIDQTPFDLAGKTIGGYEIISRLGAGGMGEVCLARQISLDRMVALKILPVKFSKNPEFLMRFTREALSAAQLTHHNIVAVHDVGQDQGVHFISMEFVKGKNLGDMVRDDGKMELETAAGYVLQAARGLKYAHERGIVHRDIKPDNLMVNEHGLVKIADMGLAKMKNVEETPRHAGRKPDSTLLAKAKGNLTELDIAMGTPAYMPPEQAQDASKVDHRADQYSLGCTLYYLCAGRAPFSGASAMEIISQHITDPPPPLEQHIRRVPSALNTIITRMLQKDPAERYPSMAQVITDLEAYLGVESERGAYSPTDQHVEILEIEELAYNNAPAARKRKIAVAAFFAVMSLLVVGSLGARKLLPEGVGGRIGAAALGLLVLTPLVNFLLDGMFNKTFLFRRVRSVFFGMTLKGWASALSGALLLAVTLYIFQPVTWLASAMMAFGLALIYQKAVIRKLKAQRAGPAEAIQTMLKKLRIRGVSEDALQDFVYRYSGEHWEELFEELFGYGAMIFARTKWALVDRIKPRKKFATWRDPIARWLDDVEAARKRARERRALARAEAERLKAKGIEEKVANRRAEEAADQTMKEGLLKATVIMQPGETMVEGKGVKITSWDVASVSGPGYTVKSRIATLYQLARMAIGLAIVALFAANKLGINLPLPGPLAALEPTLKSMEPMLYGYHGLAAGLIIFITAFSIGTLMPTAAFIGGLLLVGLEPIVALANRPEFTQTTAYWAAVGAMGIGFGMCLIDKILGGKF